MNVIIVREHMSTHVESAGPSPDVAVQPADRSFLDAARADQLLVDVVLPAHVCGRTE